MSNITKLATTSALDAVDNEIHQQNKYINTSEFNKLTADSFTERLKEANIVTKCDIADFGDKRKYLNIKLTSNKSKELLVESSKTLNIGFKSFYWSKLLIQSWWTSLLNFSTPFLH